MRGSIVLPSIRFQKSIVLHSEFYNLERMQQIKTIYSEDMAGEQGNDQNNNEGKGNISYQEKKTQRVHDSASSVQHCSAQKTWTCSLKTESSSYSSNFAVWPGTRCLPYLGPGLHICKRWFCVAANGRDFNQRDPDSDPTFTAYWVSDFGPSL